MKIIRIENPPSDRLEIDFIFGNVCNYKCHYCFPGSNEGTHRWPDYKNILPNMLNLLDFYKNHAGKNKFDIKITGGEPTLWPELTDFILELKKQASITARISTNGSRTLEYWKRSYAVFDEITISVHNEFVNLDHIISVADFIHQQRTSNLYVYVLMDPFNWEESVNCWNYLLENSKDWFLSIMPVLINRETVYTKEQQDFMLGLKKRISSNVYPSMSQIPVVYLEDGTSEPYNFKKIIFQNANRFKGYRCNLGVDRIFINADGKIKGTCGQELFGDQLNIRTNDFIEKLGNLQEINAVICEQESCTCSGEIVLTKEKI